MTLTDFVFRFIDALIDFLSEDFFSLIFCCFSEPARSLPSHDGRLSLSSLSIEFKVANSLFFSLDSNPKA